MGEEGLADAFVFVGAVVDDTVFIDVEDGAEHEFGLVEGVGEVGNIGEVAVRHAHYIIDAQGGLMARFGTAAIIEVLFVGVGVLGAGIGTKARLVWGGVEIVAQEAIIGGSKVGTLGDGD